MNNNELRTLKILEEIEKDYAPSQRELARQLNISLGLVNSFIKRLVQKGCFKVKNIPKNRVKYILTPKGMAEKTRLTYRYIQYSLEFYKRSRQELRGLFHNLVRQEVSRVIYYGASDLAEIAYLSLQETHIKLVAVVDDFKIGDKFLDGIVVTDPLELGSISFDRILITSMGSIDTVLEKILKQGIPRSKVVMLE